MTIIVLVIAIILYLLIGVFVGGLHLHITENPPYDSMDVSNSAAFGVLWPLTVVGGLLVLGVFKGTESIAKLLNREGKKSEVP